jgi:hypothetical protein
MKFLAVSLFLSIAWLPPAALAKKAADYPATYAGGSLPLNHQKVRTALGKDEMIFVQGARRIAVPVKSITEISCGTEVRHPLMHLGKGQDHYVGVAWVGAGGTGAHAQVLLKLSRGEYRDFLAALERATGMKAINTNQVPTVVRYQI